MSEYTPSIEVLKEYEHIANWLERESVLLGPVGDTMHALAAEAFWRLLAVAKGHHRIPRYAMLDIWQALYGTSHPEFDEFYKEHGYAETWARLVGAVRDRLTREREEARREAVAEFAKQHGIGDLESRPLYDAQQQLADAAQTAYEAIDTDQLAKVIEAYKSRGVGSAGIAQAVKNWLIGKEPQ